MSSRYALIIANTEYSDSNLAQLSAPGKDAKDFARVLEDKDIAGFDDVKVILNQTESYVREAIDEFFDLKKPDDLLLLYFSGHGVRDEMGSLYLALKNTSRARLRATAIKSDFIREAMDRSRSKRQILILDCCNSGAFAQGTKGITGGSIGTASAFEGTGYGRIVLTASDSTQFAWEGDKVIGETQNSLFTHFLIQGLEGNADSDGDGRITVDELFDYAYEQTVTRTPNQTPGKWAYKQQGEIVLRQSTRIENIKPVALPEELIEATEDARTFVREGAVKQLEKHVKGKNLGLARSAREALEKMAREDDSRRVAEAAAQVLEAIHQAEQVAAQKTEQDHAAREEDKNLIELKSAQEQSTLEKIETERKEKERLAAQKAEKERIAREKSESERKSKAEAQRLARQKAKNNAGKILENTKSVFSLFKKISSKNWAIAGIILTVILLGLSGIKFMKFSPTLTETSTVTRTPTTSATKLPTSTKQSTATATKLPTATKRPTATATVNTGSWSILVKDTFDNNNNGWQIGGINDALSSITANITNGKYAITDQISLGISDYQRLILPNITTPSDFFLSVDVADTSSLGSRIGLIFRASNDSNYEFYIDGSSFFIYLNHPDINISDYLASYETSSAIKKGETNRLSVLALGSHYLFYINEQIVWETENNVIPSGGVGLYYYVHGNKLLAPNTRDTFVFDNFELRTP